MFHWSPGCKFPVWRTHRHTNSAQSKGMVSSSGGSASFSFNKKLHRFVSRVRDSKADAVEALVALRGKYVLIYTFPLLKPVPCLLWSMKIYGNPVILIVQGCPLSVVCQSHVFVSWCSKAFIGFARIIIPRTDFSPCSLVSGSYDLAVESQFLWYIVDSVIRAMLKAHKSASHKIYHCTWKSLFSDVSLEVSYLSFSGPCSIFL